MIRSTVTQLLCVIALLASSATQAHTCDPQWLPGEGVPGTNAKTWCQTLWDPDGDGPGQELLVAGGEFDTAGTTFGSRVAVWDGSRWQSIGSIGYGKVTALGVFEGDLYAGGEFIIGSDTSFIYLARWDGTTWLPMNADGIVRALLVYQDELIVGGLFSQIGGISARGIARFDGTSWNDLDGSLASGIVRSLGVFENYLVAGGGFTSVGGITVKNIARWNGDAWKAFGNGIPGNSVDSVTVFNESLVASGNFHFESNGSLVNCVAQWNGTSWLPLGSGLGSSFGFSRAYAVIAYKGLLIAGGIFETAGDTIVDGIAQWDGRSWQRLGWPHDLMFVYSLISFRDDLIVAGEFWNVLQPGMNSRNIARWNGSAWSSLPAHEISWAYKLIEYQGEAIAAGYFASSDGAWFRGVAYWDGNSWLPRGVVEGYVYALAIHNDMLVIAGEFSSVNGSPAASVARWDGESWSSFTTGPGRVEALTVYEGTIIAGGYGFVKQWNGSSWANLGGVPFSPQTYALAVYNGQLIVGANLPANAVSYWTGTSWEQLGGGVNGSVRAITIRKDKLIVGGSFSTAGSIEANRIAAWDGLTWQALGDGLPNIVQALTTHHDDLVASSGDRVARWNGADWQQIGKSNGYQTDLLSHKGELLAGGHFTAFDGQVCAHFARWTDSNIPVISVGGQPHGVTVACATSASFTVTPASGYVGISYQWRKDGSPLFDGSTKHGSTISGASSASLTIVTPHDLDEGEYDVIVWNECGETVSDVAILIVNRCGDLTGDGVVNVNDLLAVINAWGMCQPLPAPCEADVAPPNGDGLVNENDLLLVIDNWG